MSGDGMIYSPFTGREHPDLEVQVWAALGEVMHHVLTPKPEPGPPYAHTIAPPPVVYTRSGKVLYRPPAKPWFTLTEG